MAELANPTEVSICSNALLKLGDDTITSLDDSTTRARRCKNFYAHVRDEVLRAHNWNFTIKRATLAQLADAPLYDFDFAYKLPSDYLMMLGADDKTLVYRLESGKLLSSNTSVAIRYVAGTTDTAIMDSLFVSALTARMSQELAIPTTGDKGIYDRMAAEYTAKLQEARTRDGQEDAPQVLTSNVLTEVRNGSPVHDRSRCRCS